MIGKYTVCNICQVRVERMTTKSPGILELSQTILSRYIHTFLETVLGMLLGFWKDGSLDDRPPTDRTAPVI